MSTEVGLHISAPTEWRHARWVEPHPAQPGEVHKRGTHGADPISSECGVCGEVLLPAATEVEKP